MGKLGPIVAFLALLPVAAAAQGRCPSLAIETDARVRTRWPNLAERVRDAFGGRDDIDTCARVRLGMRSAALEVAVSLPDGRSASRVLERPADVEPTLAALLLVPESSAPAPEAKAEAEPAPELPAPATIAPIAPARPAAPKAGHAIRRDAQPVGAGAAPLYEPAPVAIEFSLITGARAGDGMVSGGLGLLSVLDISSFLIGCEGRFERYTGPIADEGLDGTLSLAVLGGYRIRIGTMALDLAAGPALAMITAHTTESIVLDMNRAPAPEVSSSVPVSPRLAVATHYRFAMDSVLRAFVGIDGQFGPARADETPRSARLPEWAAGIVLGATVGTR